MEKTFERREQELREENEQLKKRCRDEETRLAHDRELAEQKMQYQRKIHDAKIAWETENLEKEWEKLKRETKKDEKVRIQNADGLAVIDVGGREFKTLVSTLACRKESLFFEMLKANTRGGENVTRLFIDRDPKHFRLILNFLRQGTEVLRGADLRKADERDLHDILCEARYYRLSDLEQLIQWQMIGLQTPLNFASLASKKYFASTTPSKDRPCKYVTAQEILLADKNLTRIEFDHVWFKHKVSFKGSNLAEATFRGCIFDAAINFTNADLYRVTFERCTGIEASKLVLTGANKEGVTPRLPDI